MASSTSLTVRAVLALVLLVGFYVMAVVIAFALLFLCYAMVVHGRRIDVRLLLFAVLGAGAILWSLMPRFDRFEAPGPELAPHEHPRLFRELEGVAQAVNQRMPAEVYLVPGVNAWVSTRGGIMGIGSRRVMGLGLPLLQCLSVTQLRAVLAHEFGQIARSMDEFTAKLARVTKQFLSKEDAAGRVPGVVGAALGLALHDRGWTLDTGPGLPIAFKSANREILPFEQFGKLADGTLSEPSWLALCEELGIRDQLVCEAGGGPVELG